MESTGLRSSRLSLFNLGGDLKYPLDFRQDGEWRNSRFGISIQTREVLYSWEGVRGRTCHAKEG